MKVIYVGRESRRTNSLPEGDIDVIELLSNDWNDYGYETTFRTVCRVGGKRLELGTIRLLLEAQTNSRRAMNALLKSGWDGTFPIPQANYISTPSEIAFYEQLDGVLPDGGAIKVAAALRDASYLVHLAEDDLAKQLVDTEGFRDSLQRERGCIESYLDGWRVLDRESVSANNIIFRFKDVYKNISKIELRFGEGDSPLPRDINVLIGANGVGKSRLLHQLVEAWIADGTDDANTGFETPPNLSRLVVISYSPFELFPVDMASSNLLDKSTYQYCGFRGRSTPTDTSDSETLPSIRLSREIPKKDAANSLLACISDDQRYRVIKGWGQKIKTAERVLRSAIDFDHMALMVDPDTRVKFFNAEALQKSPLLKVEEHKATERYVLVSEDTVLGLNHSRLSEHAIRKIGVAFIKDGAPLSLRETLIYPG